MQLNPLLMATSVSIAAHIALALFMSIDYGTPSPFKTRLSISWKTTAERGIDRPTPLPSELSQGTGWNQKSEPSSAQGETIGAPSPPAPIPDHQEYTSSDVGIMPYYGSHDLDARPLAIEGLPENPEDLREYSWDGSMVVTLWISSEGMVDYANIAPTTAPPDFEQRVLAHLYKMTFSPGQKNGRPAPSTIKIRVDFSANANSE